MKKKQIDYYEFPNGTVVKSVWGDGVYRFDSIKKVWEIDYSLTSEFAWDRPYGEPCLNLRKKVDVCCDLPPFPRESELEVGNVVLIGAYPQKSAHDFSPIEWIVLEADGCVALCISKYCLITSGYCDPQKAYGKPEMLWWENSTAREICNHHFFECAFSEEEKARIVPTTISEVQFGTQCKDSVFILSEKEVCRYFPTPNQRRASPTPYATQKGALTDWISDTEALSPWWVLPEENAYGFADGSIYPKVVHYSGSFIFHGRNAYHGDFTIRPCIRIKYKYDKGDVN